MVPSGCPAGLNGVHLEAESRVDSVHHSGALSRLDTKANPGEMGSGVLDLRAKMGEGAQTVISQKTRCFQQQ